MKTYRGLHNLMQRRANYRVPRPPARVYARPSTRVYARPPEPPRRPYTHHHARPVDLAKLREFVKSLERVNRRMSRQTKSFFDWPWETGWGMFGRSPNRENISLREERRRRWARTSTTSSDFTTNTPFGMYPVYNLGNDRGATTDSTMSW